MSSSSNNNNNNNNNKNNNNNNEDLFEVLVEINTKENTTIFMKEQRKNMKIKEIEIKWIKKTVIIEIDCKIFCESMKKWEVKWIILEMMW